METEGLLKKYKGAVDWNIAGLFSHDEVLLFVFNEMRRLNLEIPIAYVFGSIPCLMQGGHVNAHNLKLNDAFKILDQYDELEIGCRLTFSNHLLEKRDLKEKKSNRLLEYLNDKKKRNHGVIVSSDNLAAYIRKKYPNLQLIASVIKPAVEVGWGKETPEYYNHLFDLYDIVVVNITRADDPGFLEQISHPEKCEFIANSHCYPNCKYSAKHYELAAQLGIAQATYMETPTIQLHRLERLCKEQRAKKPLMGTNLSFEKINQLIELGFLHYKIEGRNFPSETLLRDLGDYVFHTPYFNRFLHAIYNRPI